MNRRLAKKFDLVVVTSDYSAGEWSTTSARVSKVPLGVDLATFHPSRGKLRSNSAGLQLCYEGRMSHEKHPQLAVAAARELHRRDVDFELHMYGTGPDLAQLRREAGDTPVYFHGFVSGREALAEKIAMADISLSVSPTETFGLAVLEALACGTPVVTADRGGARELVTAECGDWGTADPIGIADAIQRLSERAGASLRRAARSRAEEFDWANPVSQMMEIHQKIAHRTN